MVRDEAVLLDIVRAAQLALKFRQDMDNYGCPTSKRPRTCFLSTNLDNNL